MPPSCIVFDFDGTLTDPGQVASALQRATRRELARRLTAGEAQVAAWWTAAERELELAPVSEAWMVDGSAAVSIRADLYVWTNAVTRRLLQNHGPGGLAAEALDAWVVEVHRAAHLSTPAPFRDDAAGVLDSLTAAGKHVFVVTNSHGAQVEARLDALSLEHRPAIRVLGGANKHVIGPCGEASEIFERVPASMPMPGLGRPVLLRRGRYFDKLSELWGLCGATSDDTLVCGDIFEIDLALPAALGCRTLLVADPRTPDYERALVASLPGGTVGGLASVLACSS